MNTRTRTIASFFSVAMAAMLVGAVVTSQIRPGAALARPLEPADSVARPSGPVTLDTFRDIARLQTPGVVNIRTATVVRGQRGGDSLREFFGDDMMERFFGPQEPQGGGRGERGGRGGRAEGQTQRSVGSGFIVDKEGYILTNRHVVEGAGQITVSVGRRDYPAKLVGRDARTDVALLKIEPKETLTTLNLGDSDQAQVGEWVMAIGNPFGLGGNSVTVGVLSYKGRPVPLGVEGTAVDMIQTDASINPGNSGGPLLNTRGEVIGINTLIMTRSGVPQSAGVGFAVPINVAKEILPQLRQTGKVIRGFLGVSIQGVTEDLAKSLKMKDAKGAIVSDVHADSPAEKAGVKPGDVVVGVDGRMIEDNGDLSSYIASKKPGTKVDLKVLREGAEQTIAVTLGTFRDQDEDTRVAAEDGESFGMTLHNLTPEWAQRLELPRTIKGVVVMDVEAGEAAEEAGLTRGDVIVSVNGQSVSSVEEFEQRIKAAKADGLAHLRVRRGNTHSFIVLKLT